MILQHTDKRYEEELQRLKEMILKMGGLVESMIHRSVESLVQRNSILAKEVISQDREVNRMEMGIDDLCLRILALHQPAASDLRFVAVGFKISTDLERMGDLSVNICEQALELNQEEAIKPYVDLPQIALKSQSMVKEALDAFVSRDTDKAQSICEADDEVDALNKKICQDLIQLMSAKPETVSRGVRLILVSRHLERIADHATNIAEEVNFFVKGQDMRHAGSKEVDIQP